MGQIIGGASKPKRCNISKLSQLGTPAAGEYILVSSDNSMNAAGQGNFDAYIVGDGTTAATALPLIKTYANDADDEPTIGSDKLVKSGGVFSSLSLEEDIPLIWRQGSLYNHVYYPSMTTRIIGACKTSKPISFSVVAGYYALVSWWSTDYNDPKQITDGTTFLGDNGAWLEGTQTIIPPTGCKSITITVKKGAAGTTNISPSEGGEAISDFAELEQVKNVISGIKQDISEIYGDLYELGIDKPLSGEWYIGTLSGSHAYTSNNSKRIIASFVTRKVISFSVAQGYYALVSWFSEEYSNIADNTSGTGFLGDNGAWLEGEQTIAPPFGCKSVAITIKKGSAGTTNVSPSEGKLAITALVEKNEKENDFDLSNINSAEGRKEIASSYFVGQGTTYSFANDNIVGLTPGKKYLFVFDNPSWDIPSSGIIESSHIFGLNGWKDGTETAIKIYTYKEVQSSSIPYSFYFVLEQAFDYLRAGGRATNGATVKFSIYEDAEQETYKKDKTNVLSIKKAKQSIESASWEDATFCAMFFSDAHKQAGKISEMVALANQWKLFDAVLNGGDTVLNLGGEENLDWYNNIVDYSELPILTALGNHDAWSANHVTGNAVDSYNLVIAKVASTANIIQPENAASNGLCYYYKDFSSVRVVVLDLMYWDSAELTWFEGVLSDAKTNNKHVLCLQHAGFLAANNVENLGNGTWNSFGDTAAASDYCHIPTDASEAVDTFISDGGNFVAWICGHCHGDILRSVLVNGRKQLVYSTCSTTNRNSTTFKSDEVNDYDFVCFNAISVDTASNKFRLLRIGANIDLNFRTRHLFCWNYGTKTLISEE